MAAYRRYGNIYQIAIGSKANGALLKPERAIFSAVCSVLSLDDEKTKIRLLGDEAYTFSQDAIQMYHDGKLEYFIDEWPEAKGMLREKIEEPYERNPESSGNDALDILMGGKFISEWPEAGGMVRKWFEQPNKFPFQDWSMEEQLQYMNRNAYPINNNDAIRLASAKTRREYFPATDSFVRRHLEDLETSYAAGIIQDIIKKC